MHFRIDGEPPHTTAQEKELTTIRRRMKNGKVKTIPIMYDSDKVKIARQYFLWNLARFKPEKPYTGAVYLKTVWVFGCGMRHADGEYKTTRPDTENSLKLFKDCMTKTGFWKDDSQVAYEVTVKKWGHHPGIEVYVFPL